MHNYILIKILNATFSILVILTITALGGAKELAIFGLIAVIESYLGIFNNGAATRFHELSREGRLNRLSGLLYLLIFLLKR